MGNCNRWKKQKITYTRDEISSIVGKDIEKYGTSITELQKLKNKMPSVVENIE